MVIFNNILPVNIIRVAENRHPQSHDRMDMPVDCNPHTRNGSTSASESATIPWHAQYQVITRLVFPNQPFKNRHISALLSAKASIKVSTVGSSIYDKDSNKVIDGLQPVFVTLPL